jgi:uncharacterized protein (DUF58 family)
MLPVPSREALLALWGSLGMLALGWLTGVAALVTLGGAGVLGLCVAFALTVPAALRLREQHVELTWWVEPSRALPVAGALFEAHASLRNRGESAVVLDDLHVIAPVGVEVITGLEGPLVIPSASSAELDLKVRAPAVGRVVLHGVVASVPGPFGLFSAAVRFPIPLSAKVLPRAASRAASALPRAASETNDRATRSALRVRGAGTELYEIREYQPGDPFGAIAWKPSARAGRLMVREVEREAQHSVAIILDVGATMRGGSPGARKLDLAIEAVASLAKDALARGAHVSLRAVDGRVVARVPAGDSSAHLSPIYDALLQVTEIVDEDLTDIDDETLARRVASYLRQQEGIDLVHAGELDMAALTGHVARALDGERTRALPIASSRALGRLRRYCQSRGIALPYRSYARLPMDEHRKANGLAQALRDEAGDTRATRSLIVISDLDAIDSHAPWLPTLSMLKRRGHNVLVLVPELGVTQAHRAELEGALLERDLYVAMARTEALRMQDARRALGRLGIPAQSYRLGIDAARGSHVPPAPRQSSAVGARSAAR